jgi:AraC-like DNA-binding protein/ligand-binding sensor domain-containing protein
MKQIRVTPYLLVFFALILQPFIATAQPYCEVRHYDEFDGLSQRLVKQIVETPDGLLWFATWNGLNRYDGYRFAQVKPAADDVARRYSARFGDVRVTADGNLWCKVDERLLLFDTRSYRFSAADSQLQAAGLPMLSLGNRQSSVVRECPYSPLIYAHADTLGGRWAITKGGDVYYAAPAATEWQAVTHIDAPEGTLFYGTTDRHGRVWLRSTVGAFSLTLGTCPYTTLTPSLPSRVRQMHRDASGRLWLAESDANVVVCYEPTDTLLLSPLYLQPDGALTAQCVPFGHAAYSFTSAPDGTLWIGTKPDGLFRLTPKAVAYGDGSAPMCYDLLQLSSDAAQPHTLSSNNIYDLRYDGYGRLWVATLGGGIDCLLQPAAAQPQVVRLGENADYPAEALRVRKLLLMGDSLLLAATTGGLLTVPLPPPGALTAFRPRLHVSEPERAGSLGCVALMDVAVAADGRLFVATESDGINVLCHRPMVDDVPWTFRRMDAEADRMPDVALAVVLDEAEQTLRVVSNNMVYAVALATGEVRSYGPDYWHRKLRFCDAAPLPLSGGRWLCGVEDGAVILSPSMPQAAESALPLCFTSVSIDTRPDSLLSSVCDTVVLSATERDVTLSFAVPGGGEVHYASRLDDGAWMQLGGQPTVTLLNLTPGTHSLEVCATCRPGAVRRMVIVVTPTVWETPLARVLYVLFALAVVGGCAYTVWYVRTLRRKQRKTLAAYLKLLNQPRLTAPAAVSFTPPPAAASVLAAESKPEVRSTADELFIKQVAEFIHQHIGNADVNIDDLAAATATSRSGLNRKMKHLFGMSPAEFIRESRISRAATLLTSTTLTISEIAWECGFSDLNYFGKCFKAKHKVSPTAYRNQHPR